jgi:LEA14-like dessication related protein
MPPHGCSNQPQKDKAMFSWTHMPRIIRALLLASLCSALGACSVWKVDDLESPDVYLLDVSVTKATLLEQRFMLRLRIDNPNPVALPVRGLDYELYLNEIKLVEGKEQTWFSIPAKGQHEFEIPVRTNLWMNVRPLAKLLQQSNMKIHYRLNGDILTGLLFGQRVHMARNGEIIPRDYLPE